MLDKLFKTIEKNGSIELSDDFKKTLTESVEVMVSEEKAKVSQLEESYSELVEENEELKAEIETLKENTMDEVKKEVESFKEQLVEKISAYLDSELDELIPEEAIEAVAKLEVYEPLVEGFKATIGKYGIKIDSEGHELLKEAKDEIESLREAYDITSKKNVELVAEMEKINATVTLMEKADGLTEEQKRKMFVIFKNKTVEEINERFDEVRDMIVESTTEKDEETEEDTKTVVTEKVESDKKVVTESDDFDLGQRLL